MGRGLVSAAKGAAGELLGGVKSGLGSVSGAQGSGGGGTQGGGGRPQVAFFYSKSSQRASSTPSLRSAGGRGGAVAPQYVGVVDTAGKVWAEGGMRAMFAGSWARVAKTAPSMALSWGVYEAVKTVLVAGWGSGSDGSGKEVY